MAFELDVTGTNPKATTKQALEAAVNAAISVVAGAAALGYPLKESVSAGLSSTANGQGFSVRTTEGLSLYVREGSSATLVSTLATGTQKKSQVDFATTANITLSGIQTIDGASRAAGTTALVKNQSSSAQNGLYTVATGTWTRRTDMDTAGEVQGALVYVASGTVNGGRTYYTGSAVTTLGTDAIVWQVDSDQSAIQGQIDAIDDRLDVPSNVSGLVLWLDGDDGKTIAKDGSNLISAWTSKVGGHVAVQSDANRKPTYGRSAGKSGKNAVVHSPGTSSTLDYLQVTSFVLPQPFTVVVCYKGSNTNGFVLDGTSTASRVVIAHGIDSAGSGKVGMFAGSVVADSTRSVGQQAVVTAVFNGASSDLRVNGLPRATGDAGANDFVGIRFGTLHTFASSNPLDGEICEVLIYDHDLSQREKLLIEAYLADKWKSEKITRTKSVVDDFGAVPYASDAAARSGVDSTAAIQAAIEHCYFNGGGVVEFDPGFYRVSGPLNTTYGGNAQIALPIRSTTATKIAIKLHCKEPASSEAFREGLASSGATLISTLVGQTYGAAPLFTPSVFGGPTVDGNAVAINDFTNLHITIDGIGIRLNDNPSLAGFDLGCVAAVNVIDGRVDVTATPTTVSEPTHPWAWALIMPKNNNNVMSTVGNFTIVGTYVGVAFAEHFQLVGTLQVMKAKIGYVPMGPFNHAVHISGNSSIEKTPYTVAGCSPETGVTDIEGVCMVNFAFMGLENSREDGLTEPLWTAPVQHIKDANNLLYGKMLYAQVKAGTGPVDTPLLKTGGDNLRLENLSTGPV